MQLAENTLSGHGRQGLATRRGGLTRKRGIDNNAADEREWICYIRMKRAQQVNDPWLKDSKNPESATGGALSLLDGEIDGSRR